MVIPLFSRIKHSLSFSNAGDKDIRYHNLSNSYSSPLKHKLENVTVTTILQFVQTEESWTSAIVTSLLRCINAQ